MEEAIREPLLAQQEEIPSSLINHLYIDHFLARRVPGCGNSLLVLKLWLVTQNLAFVVAGTGVVALLVNSSLKFTNFTAFILLVLAINICGGVLSTLAVLSLRAFAITLALCNNVTVWVEYWLFTSVYNGIPALPQNSKRMARLSQCDQQRNTPTLEEDSLLCVTDGSSELEDRKCSKKILKKISEIPYIAAWRFYLQQEVLRPFNWIGPRMDFIPGIDGPSEEDVGNIRVGKDVHKVIKPSRLVELKQVFPKEKFLLEFGGNCINMVLEQDASGEDAVRGWLVAAYAAQLNAYKQV
ncbi:hypothetical protein Fmac_026509 [Flemingia macrophylla]|uniref:Solute carrier family 40 member n=1 Tax=Flemingia macrophylla TaxID=520843 RepID=A0ABD1LGS8_9FABA